MILQGQRMARRTTEPGRSQFRWCLLSALLAAGLPAGCSYDDESGYEVDRSKSAAEADENGEPDNASRDGRTADGNKTAREFIRKLIRKGARNAPNTNGPPQEFIAVVAPKPLPARLYRLKKLGCRYDTDAEGRVTEIDFNKKKLTPEALEFIQQFPHLEVLNLDGTGIKDDQLADLSGFKKLTSLSLQSNPVTDNGLVHLKDMKTLEVLALEKTKITGRGLRHIKGLTNLRVLNLSQCRIGDDPLDNLKAMKQMETLALQNAGVRGPGLKHVGGLTNMITLNLDDSKIEGRNLLHLKPLQKLRIIYMRDSRVSQRSVEKLEELIPSLAIFQ